MSMERGVAGVARNVTAMERGVAGVARSVTSAERGVSGVARKFFPGGTPLSEYAEGDIVLIPENGENVEFYVAKHDYESGLNGSGRTLLHRASKTGNRVWASASTTTDDFADSDIYAWLNGDYKAYFSEAVQNAMGETKYKCIDKVYSVNTRSSAIFLPGISEGGGTPTDGEGYAIGADGSQLPTWKNFDSNGWTRSFSSHRYPYRFYSLGTSNWSFGAQLCTISNPIRPLFTLPSDTPFDPDTNIIAI